MVKERFFIFSAKRVEVVVKENINEDWMNDNFEDLSSILEKNGYDISTSVDIVPIFDENVVEFFYLIPDKLTNVMEKDFRGYLMPVGSSYIPDKEMIDIINSNDTQFEYDSIFKIEEVIVNDASSSIDYYLKCFVETEESVKLEM